MKKNYLYAILTVFLWSTLAPVVKLILSDIPNLQALAVSSLFSFFFLLLLNLKNGHLKNMYRYTPKDYCVLGGLGFVGMFVYNALYFYGLTQLTSQEACIVNYLWPIMLVLFSCVFLKEKLTLAKGFAMVCSFTGIVILSAGGSAAADGNAGLGILSCAVAAACYGLFSVLNKKAGYDQNIAMMMFWLVVAVCSAGLGLVTETWIPIQGAQWLGILWFGVIVDAFAYLIWAKALEAASDTAGIANLAFLTPFLSLVISAILLKEQIRLRALVALFFIIGGILLQSVLEQRKKKQIQTTE